MISVFIALVPQFFHVLQNFVCGKVELKAVAVRLRLVRLDFLQEI